MGLAILVGLILIFVVFKSCSGGDNTGAVAPSPTPTPVVTESTLPTDSASPSSTATGGECADSDIEVTAEVPKATVPVGTSITFLMNIKNMSTVDCTRNVGPKVNSIAVTSGGEAVWSSDDCSPAGGDQVESIPPGATYRVQATWNQEVTAASCDNPAKATAGGYDVEAKNGTVKSSKVSFEITG